MDIIEHIFNEAEEWQKEWSDERCIICIAYDDGFVADCRALGKRNKLAEAFMFSVGENEDFEKLYDDIGKCTITKGEQERILLRAPNCKRIVKAMGYAERAMERLNAMRGKDMLKEDAAAECQKCKDALAKAIHLIDNFCGLTN